MGLRATRFFAFAMPSLMPICGKHVGGWSGWRWMLFLEGVPALIGGIATYFLLTDRPEQATWLQPEEKAWLAAELPGLHRIRVAADERFARLQVRQEARRPTARGRSAPFR